MRNEYLRIPSLIFHSADESAYLCEIQRAAVPYLASATLCHPYEFRWMLVLYVICDRTTYLSVSSHKKYLVQCIWILRLECVHTIGECRPLPCINEAESIRDSDWYSTAQFLDEKSRNSLEEALKLSKFDMGLMLTLKECLMEGIRGHFTLAMAGSFLSHDPVTHHQLEIFELMRCVCTLGSYIILLLDKTIY